MYRGIAKDRQVSGEIFLAGRPKAGDIAALLGREKATSPAAAGARKQRSVTALSGNDGTKCPHQDHDVVGDAPIAHIICVHLNALIISAVIATADLPDTRYSRPGLKIETELFAITPYLGRHDRTRSNQTHITPDDVYELR